MGTWGTGLYSSDEAQGIEEWEEEAKKGVRFKNRLRIKDISNLM